MNDFKNMTQKEFDAAMLADFIEHGMSVEQFEQVKKVTREVLKNKTTTLKPLDK